VKTLSCTIMIYTAIKAL